MKREDLTLVRSYKIRDAFNFVSKMLGRISSDVAFVCASAENHAQGVSFLCRYFKRNGVIFMPVMTPQQKIEKTRILSKEFIDIRLVGEMFDVKQNATQLLIHGFVLKKLLLRHPIPFHGADHEEYTV